MEMRPLEQVDVLFLDDLLELLYLFPLVRAEGLQVDLLHDLMLHIVDIEANRGSVDLFTFTFESVTKVINEFLRVKSLLFCSFIEVSNMLVCDPSFLVTVLEDLRIEGNINLIRIHRCADLMLHYFLQLIKILQFVELIKILLYAFLCLL